MARSEKTAPKPGRFSSVIDEAFVSKVKAAILEDQLATIYQMISRDQD